MQPERKKREKSYNVYGHTHSVEIVDKDVPGEVAVLLWLQVDVSGLLSHRSVFLTCSMVDWSGS